MDKRSFNLLFTVVAASMVIIGTYKIAKKKNPATTTHVQTTARLNK
jgi:hypothetical protein